jgi:hypothetical protein
MPSGVYKRTPEMMSGKWKRTPEHNRINSLALKKAGIRPPSQLGVKQSGELKKKHSISMKGKNTWSRGRKISKEHIEALRRSWLGKHLSIEHRRKISEAQKGEKSCHWKGGTSLKRKQIRESIEYRLWREAVFARDNWTCQECKVKGGILHAHHIKPWVKYPELRFAIDNGQTLHKDCHKKIHWGGNTNAINEKTD